MRLLSVKSNVVPLDAFGAQNNAEGQAHPLQDRSLLDMQLKIGSRVFLFPLGVREFVDLDATTPQGLFQFNAVAVGAIAVCCNRMGPGKCRGAQQTAAKS